MTDKNAINKNVFIFGIDRTQKEMLSRSKEIISKPFKDMRTK